MWFMQTVLGFNRGVYWPVHFTSNVSHWRRICVGVDVSPGYSSGCYIQGIGRIYIGDYTQIAPNVGIISANHSLYNTRHHDSSEVVRIGAYGWIGMNAVVLPGVVLGDFTIVGAGAVVTKSFPEGYCVVAGNPAKVIRNLAREEAVRYRNPHEYNGYIPHAKFAAFRAKYLNV